MYGLPADPRLGNRIFPTQPQQPQIATKQSKIPPRGSRPLRSHMTLEEMQARERVVNSPVVNEMLSYTPRVFRIEDKSLTDRIISEESQQHRTNMQLFFSSICSPPDSLPLPDDPTINSIEDFSLHQDPVCQAPSEPILICKEMTTVPAFTEDDEAVSMRLKPRFLNMSGSTEAHQ